MSDWLLHHELEKQVYWRPDRSAFEFEGRRHTYAEFDARVNRLARALRDGGVAPGETVVAHGLNHVDLYTLFFACSKAGIRWSPISRFQSRTNVEYICETLEPAMAVYTDDPAITDELLPAVRGAVDGPFVSLDDTTAADGDETLEGFVGDATAAAPPWADDPTSETVHTIFWTSGTSGTPKGVLRDHHTTHHFCDEILAVFPFSDDHRRLIPNDMMLTIPYPHTMLPTLKTGGTNIVMRSFDPAGLVSLVHEADANVVLVAFTQANILLDHLADTADTLHLEHIHAPLLTDDVAAGLARHCEHLYQVFGMTEAGAPLMREVEPPFDGPPALGRPGVSADVRLVEPGDPAAAIDAPAPGDRGEMLIRGDMTMVRYLHDEDQRENVVDGWIRSGDVVELDEAGRIVFLGRADHRIRSGGVNVYPAEIETPLEAHPAVDDAIVLGVPDETWGERVVALVVRSEGAPEPAALAETLEEYCRQHDAVSDQMRPREYAFVDSPEEIPTGAVEKPDRGAIRERFFD